VKIFGVYGNKLLIKIEIYRNNQ